MGKKLPYTPRSRVRNAIRMLFLRSRERAACVKSNGNTCQKCGRKGSVAKGKEVAIRVHHKDGITNWEKVIDAIYEFILCPPERMECLCVECHEQEHNKEVLRK